MQVDTAELSQLLGGLQAELVERYHQILREAMFSNRSEVRPAMLSQIAAEEFATFQQYIGQPNSSEAKARGVQLCENGLSQVSVLHVANATRQFLVGRLERAQLTAILNLHDGYQSAVIEGFMKSREQMILTEQERIRSAMQRTLNRYTKQMELAAGVAAATTSILDQAELLQLAVTLIRKQFELYYTGVFLVDCPASGQSYMPARVKPVRKCCGRDIGCKLVDNP
jgi:hypothetical protein